MTLREEHRYTEGVCEQDAGENIWTKEGISDRRLEKTA
jgi:hypothetical protein